MSEPEEPQEEEAPEPETPIDEPLAKLESFSPGQIRGQRRLGDLEFTDGPEKVATIVDTLKDLREEDWLLRRSVQDRRRQSGERGRQHR